MNKSLVLWMANLLQSMSILYINVKLITLLLNSDGFFKHILRIIKQVFLLISFSVTSKNIVKIPDHQQKSNRSLASDWSVPHKSGTVLDRLNVCVFLLPAVLPVLLPAYRGWWSNSRGQWTKPWIPPHPWDMKGRDEVLHTTEQKGKTPVVSMPTFIKQSLFNHATSSYRLWHQRSCVSPGSG